MGLETVVRWARGTVFQEPYHGLVLEDVAFDRLVAAVQHPSEPTAALRELMRGRHG